MRSALLIVALLTSCHPETIVHRNRYVFRNSVEVLNSECSSNCCVVLIAAEERNEPPHYLYGSFVPKGTYGWVTLAWTDSDIGFKTECSSKYGS